MVRWGMTIDLKRCVGCNACTAACKAKNQTPPGVFYTRVLIHERGEYPNVSRVFIPVQCNHCSDPPCVRVCPTGASTQREDGIVVIDHTKCVGCRACYVACPYNNRFYLDRDFIDTGYFPEVLTPPEKMNRENFPGGKGGVAVKCDFCYDRLEEGRDPACVRTCPADARKFGDLDDPDSEVQKLIRQRHGRQPLPEAGTDPSIYYLE